MNTGPRNIGRTIRELLNSSVPPVQIRKELGCALSTITYHAKRMGRGIENRPTYDWVAINTYHQQGHPLRVCIEKFGFSKGAWFKARQTGKVVSGDQKMPLEILLAPGRKKTSRGHVKQRLLKAGLLERKCYECGITEWRGKRLAFNLDHIDGDKLNWSLENLRLVCPNCDSQSDTFAGRNVGRSSRLAGREALTLETQVRPLVSQPNLEVN